MAAIIMDGRALSAHLMPELRANVDELKSKFGCTPSLAAILVGDDPASRQYVKNKQRVAGRAWMRQPHGADEVRGRDHRRVARP